MQAIQTRFIGPTNHRGSRIKATCAAKSITFPWKEGIGADANHIAAANQLCELLGWVGDSYTPLCSGTLADGSMVHVFRHD